MKTLTIIDQDDSSQIILEDNGDTTIMREFEGFEYAEVRSVIEDIAGKQSAAHVTSKFGRRTVSVAGDIVGENVFTTRRSLLGLLRQTGNMKLVKILTYDDLALQFEADVTKFVAPYNHQVQSFLLEFTAADWRFYSQTLHSNESADELQTITNAGNERTEPVFKIYGPFTSAEIINLSNSESMTIEYGVYGVEDGDYIEVDCLNRTVLLNGDPLTPAFSAFNAEDSDFFSILPGDNILDFQTTGDGANTKLRTEWRDAYNGI